MVFEQAVMDDIPVLTELRIAYLLEDYGAIPDERLSAIRDSLPDYFRKHLGSDIFVFLCRDSGRAAGCCFLYVSEKPANPSFIGGKTGAVMNVYTLPEYRRRGIGHRLMEMLLSEAASLGLDYVELKATDEGYGLYKALKFVDRVEKYHDMIFRLTK